MSVVKIESNIYFVYYGAFGTGYMFNEAEQTLKELAAKHKKEVANHLYGQEIQPNLCLT